ncbi:MAG: hypothetical protein HYU27_09135 [Acidobacteria bacterium]|nr:hypothetical protein [Acidobacteriota bacterium]
MSGRKLFILLVLIVLTLAATQYGPAYFNAIQFNDFARQEVKFAASSRRTPDKVRASILAKSVELGIPGFSKNNIKITRRGPSFTLDVEYRWPINMRIYKHELVFHITESGEAFENASN